MSLRDNSVKKHMLKDWDKVVQIFVVIICSSICLVLIRTYLTVVLVFTNSYKKDPKFIFLDI